MTDVCIFAVETKGRRSDIVVWNGDQSNFRGRSQRKCRFHWSKARRWNTHRKRKFRMGASNDHRNWRSLKLPYPGKRPVVSIKMRKKDGSQSVAVRGSTCRNKRRTHATGSEACVDQHELSRIIKRDCRRVASRTAPEHADTRSHAQDSGEQLLLPSSARGECK